MAGFCKGVKLKEVEKNGYVLTPGRYVGVAEEDDDGVPFEEKIGKLKAELGKSFKESGKLEKEITNNLKRLKV